MVTLYGEVSRPLKRTMQKSWGRVFKATRTNSRGQDHWAPGLSASKEQKEGQHGWTTVNLDHKASWEGGEVGRNYSK